MPALNFKAEFADAVESGEKRQTIRAWRKRPFQIGDTLQLYTGQRTKNARLLRVEPCRMAMGVQITFAPIWTGKIWLGDWSLEPDAAEAFARNDGFASLAEMAQWFEKTYGLPFDGQLIMW